MGSKFFPFSQEQGFTMQSCTSACTAQTDYNKNHPNKDGTWKTCAFVNGYVLSKNGVPQGLYCSMYTQVWAASYATNYVSVFSRPGILNTDHIRRDNIVVQRDIPSATVTATLWHPYRQKTPTTVSATHKRNAVRPRCVSTTISSTTPLSRPCTHNPAALQPARPSVITTRTAGVGLSIRRAPLAHSTHSLAAKWLMSMMPFMMGMASRSITRTWISMIALASMIWVAGAISSRGERRNAAEMIHVNMRNQRYSVNIHSLLSDPTRLMCFECS